MNVILNKLHWSFAGHAPLGYPDPSRPVGHLWAPGGPVTRSRSCAIPVRFLLDSSVFFYFWLHAQEHQQQHQLLLQHPIRGPIPGPPPLFRAPLLSALIFFPSKPKFKFYIILLMDLCACLHDLSKNIYLVLTQGSSLRLPKVLITSAVGSIFVVLDCM